MRAAGGGGGEILRAGMISGRDIVFISGIEWGSLWQSSQELASRLSKAGNRVLYVENLGIRSPKWGDKGRVASRAKSWARSLASRGVRRVGEDLYVCTPIVMPPFGDGRRRYFNRRLLLPLIVWAARSVGMRDIILWTFLPTDTVLDLIGLFAARFTPTVIYHCTADFSLLTPEPSALKESERTLLELSDLVFVTCPQLAKHCAAAGGKVHIFPNGVSFDLFNQRNVGGAQVPLLSSLPRPIIGYVGGMHRFVDFRLLTEMARERRDWSWVFVGPLQAAVGELSRLPNVHLLGSRPHGELVSYIRDFDVCLVPYVESHATTTVVPSKVNEYLAAGRPVVSTRLSAVCDLNERHDVLTTVRPEAGPFLAAIEESLRPPSDPEVAARRVRVAELNDWQVHLDAMSELIEAESRESGP